MSAPFALPKQTSGKIILLVRQQAGIPRDLGAGSKDTEQAARLTSNILQAQITAKPGKGDEVETLLSACRSTAESAEEKETLTYRTTRSADDTDKFAVFEEYVLPNGLVDHGESSGSPRSPLR